MIDNVTLMLSGAQQDQPAAEMMEKCHPLGLFDASTSRNILQASSLALSPADLYEMVLVDTPLARYFTANLLTDRDLNESNINIIRESFRPTVPCFLCHFLLHVLSICADMFLLALLLAFLLLAAVCLFQLCR